MLSFDANLPHAGAGDFLELISRWNREIIDADGGMQLNQLAERSGREGGETLRRPPGL